MFNSVKDYTCDTLFLASSKLDLTFYQLMSLLAVFQVKHVCLPLSDQD